MLMTKAKVYPYINRFTGDVQIMTKKQGAELSEDWQPAKVVKNSEGKKVFRFEISSPVKGRDGKMHMGTAVIDLTEIEVPAEELEAVDGERKPE